MRLDAANGDRPYRCYDAKRCCFVREVVSVDDETAQWESFARPLRADPSGERLVRLTHQEDSIRIHLDCRLVVFNEIEDKATEQTDASRELDLVLSDGPAR